MYKRLNLTGDRPLRKQDAKALCSWWNRLGVATMQLVYKRNGNKFYHVKVDIEKD